MLQLREPCSEMYASQLQCQCALRVVNIEEDGVQSCYHTSSVGQVGSGEATNRVLTCQDLEVVLSFLKALQAPEALSHHQPERQRKVGEGLMPGSAPLD